MDPRLVGRIPRQDDPQMQALKSSLLISLLKPQPKAPKLTSQTINEFHPLLVSVSTDNLPNSPEFVKSVARIVTYIAPSQIRTHALCDYLLKLLNVISQSSGSESKQRAHTSLKLLHLLAAVYACIRRAADGTGAATYFATNIAGHAAALMQVAVVGTELEAVSTHRTVHSLLHRWTVDGIFTRSLRIRLRDIARQNYDSWLGWLKSVHPETYEKMTNLAIGPHSHVLTPRDASDDIWHDAPVSSVVPHIQGLRPIKTSDIDTAPPSLSFLDAEMKEVVSQHIRDIAEVFAGPNVPRFSSDDVVTLNGLGQPIKVASSTGQRKRKHSTYYGMMESCAKSFKTARKDLPALVQVPEPDVNPVQHFSSRNVPPPMADARDYKGSYPSATIGSSRGGYGPRGGGWNGERGRGFDGRGGSGGGRGRGGWN